MNNCLAAIIVRSRKKISFRKFMSEGRLCACECRCYLEKLKIIQDPITNIAVYVSLRFSFRQINKVMLRCVMHRNKAHYAF